MNIRIKPPTDEDNTPLAVEPDKKSALRTMLGQNKRRLLALFAATSSSAKFHWNQVAYSGAPTGANHDAPIREESLAYYNGVDENGLAQGGNPHWMYFTTPFLATAETIGPQKYTDAQKYHGLRAALSRLPSGPAFKFHAAPLMDDGDVIRSAFQDSGFKRVNRSTFLYKPETTDFDELVRNFKSDTRSKVKKARRELDVTTMPIDDFFRFYEDNLDKRGEVFRWFALNLDHKVLKQEINSPDPKIGIVAARRKSTPDDPGPHPIDAAILYTRGEDGYHKLLRVSWRMGKEDDGLPKPHQQAIKLLVTEVMLRAAKEGATIDTDGFTPGGETVYTRFGVFEQQNQDIYTRISLANTRQQLAKKIEPFLEKLRLTI